MAHFRGISAKPADPELHHEILKAKQRRLRDGFSTELPLRVHWGLTQTFALPEIEELRPHLLAEVPVYAAAVFDDVEYATAGIADAVCLDPDGKPNVIIDWKSDVLPTAETIEHYRAQVRTYLNMTGAARGLIVLATTGRIISVMPSLGPRPI